MLQQGQVFELATCGPNGKRLCAYRYRTGGRESKRVQRGGFTNGFYECAALREPLEVSGSEQAPS
jgi:hypothetical protein